MRRTIPQIAAPLALLVTFAACGGRKPPAPPPDPGAQPPPAVTTAGGDPAPPVAPPPPPTVPSEPAIGATDFTNMTVEDINKNSPLMPVFFSLDADTIDETARKVLDENAQVLKQYSSWVITIEGHADERGTSEYNLALGERRALAAKNYLLTLGIPGERLRTVSYGKEFPFNPGHDEAAWAENRRAHFMLTSK
jgi:peptidoglycan-associated lipoprotein